MEKSPLERVGTSKKTASSLQRSCYDAMKGRLTIFMGREYRLVIGQLLHGHYKRHFAAPNFLLVQKLWDRKT